MCHNHAALVAKFSRLEPAIMFQESSFMFQESRNLKTDVRSQKSEALCQKREVIPAQPTSHAGL